MAHIIVVGNEKGGSGKSTTSMHIATALSRMGWRVGVLDLDLRQRSLGRYVENRNATLQREGISLPTPTYQPLPELTGLNLEPGENAQDHRLSIAISTIEANRDFIVIAWLIKFQLHVKLHKKFGLCN